MDTVTVYLFAYFTTITLVESAETLPPSMAHVIKQLAVLVPIFGTAPT